MKVSKVHSMFLLAAFALAACSSFDDSVWPSLSGGNKQAKAQAPATPATPPAAPSMRRTPAPAPKPVVAYSASSKTRVGERVAQLKRELQALDVSSDQQRLQSTAARDRSRGAARSYHSLKGEIVARLQVGSTPGNPELVANWNAAQDSLDGLSGEINLMTSLAASIADSAATANFLIDTIQGTYALSGAVEADHEELRIVEDGTKEVLVRINSNLSELRDDITRQTTYVANERASLNNLRDAIKRGELFGPGLSELSVPVQPASYAPASSTPLVVIRFDRPDVQYEEALYSALAQALEQRPGASFDIVAVSPMSGTAADLALAQAAARRDAGSVLSTIRDMGIPGQRLALSSSARPDAAGSEVHVFVR